MNLQCKEGRFLVLCLVFLAFSFAVSASKSASSTQLLCGIVSDGVTEGKFDKELSTPFVPLAASWTGFGPSVLSYEWAIFSESLNPATIDFSQCHRQVRAIPDVMGWTRVNKQTSGVYKSFRPVVGQFYRSAVRATFQSGEQFVAFSNGVRIVDSEKASFSAQVPQPVRKATEEAASLSCSLDEANRCQQSKISVAERLAELYGAPFYDQPNVAFSSQVSLFDDDDDEDSGGGNGQQDADKAWIIAPIVGGILILAVILILLILLALFLAKNLNLIRDFEPRERAPKAAKAPKAPKAAKAPKQTAAAGMDFTNEEESKDYGMRDGVDALDASTNTVVEFPDTQIRRLSISHKDESFTESSNVPKRGRAPHPIMVSASSSFRDYRSSGN